MLLCGLDFNFDMAEKGLNELLQWSIKSGADVDKAKEMTIDPEVRLT